jgi:hypothetical protein
MGLASIFCSAGNAVGRVVDRLSAEAMLISRENEGMVTALAA